MSTKLLAVSIGTCGLALCLASLDRTPIGTWHAGGLPTLGDEEMSLPLAQSGCTTGDIISGATWCTASFGPYACTTRFILGVPAGCNNSTTTQGCSHVSGDDTTGPGGDGKIKITGDCATTWGPVPCVTYFCRLAGGISGFCCTVSTAHPPYPCGPIKQDDGKVCRNPSGRHGLSVATITTARTGPSTAKGGGFTSDSRLRRGDFT